VCRWGGSGDAPPLGSAVRPSTALLRWTFAVLVLAALATIGYLWALSVGPASAIVPLVATCPALAGVVGALILRESRSRARYVGVAGRDGRGGGDVHGGVPIFVPSHRPPGPAARWSYPLVTYVTDGIESAMAQAKAKLP
jgi:hypothetical protein